MGTLKVNTITDQAGTGAPDFSNGLSVNGGADVTDLVAGTWTPTLTNGTNISSSSNDECRYQRIGSIVFFQGTITFSMSGTGTGQLDISIPVASNFSAITDATGVTMGTNSTMDDQVQGVYGEGIIKADTTNDRLICKISTNSSGPRKLIFQGSYRII